MLESRMALANRVGIGRRRVAVVINDPRTGLSVEFVTADVRWCMRETALAGDNQVPSRPHDNQHNDLQGAHFTSLWHDARLRGDQRSGAGQRLCSGASLTSGGTVVAH